MPGPKPTVGRIVHVFDQRFSNGTQPVAAIITAVNPVLDGAEDEGRCHLTAFLTTGSVLPFYACQKFNAEDGPGPVGGAWDWPARTW